MVSRHDLLKVIHMDMNRYASIRAIESPSSLDDQQWLTYWVIYSLITLFELTFWKILVWYNSTQKLFFLFLLQVFSFQRELLAYRIPLWGYIKLVACLWLVLPIFNGAAYIYENIVRKYVKIGRYVNPNYPENQKKVLQMMTLDSRKSVERYIDRYGPDAFERVVKAVSCRYFYRYFVAMMCIGIYDVNPDKT